MVAESIDDSLEIALGGFKTCVKLIVGVFDALGGHLLSPSGALFEELGAGPVDLLLYHLIVSQVPLSVVT